MTKKIKVLHIMNGANLGGISTVVLNLYQQMDRELFQFDLALYNEVIGVNGEKLRQLGSNIFVLPLKSRSAIKYTYKLYRIIKKEEYDVVHVHQNYTSFFPIIISTMCGIKKRIAHAHTTQDISSRKLGFFKVVFSRLITPIFATNLIACTYDAGKMVFGEKALKSNKFSVIYNGIDLNSYKFDMRIRNEVRRELNLEDKFIIGNVGNLDKVKNHEYLLTIVSELIKTNKNWHLLIIGSGKLLNSLKEKALNLGVSNYVSFLGQRKDVNRLLQAMDVFAIPSLFEGFSIAGLEALTSGLPTILSDKIPNDLDSFTNSYYLPLNNDHLLWVEKLTDIMNLSYDREIGYEEARKNGYEINDKAKELGDIYYENLSLFSKGV